MATSNSRAISLLNAAKSRKADTGAGGGNTAAAGTTAEELYNEARALGLKAKPFQSPVFVPEYGQTFNGGDGYPVHASSPNYDYEYNKAVGDRQSDENTYMQNTRAAIEARNIENEMARVARQQEQAVWDTNYLKRQQDAADRATKARGTSSGSTVSSLISSDTLRLLMG